VAGQLPGQLGPALIAAARDAFTEGLHVGAAISAIGTVSLAVFVLVLLRRVRTGSESEDQALGGP
jgi:MFS transporter, DHA2 family, multidrug resistance protein